MSRAPRPLVLLVYPKVDHEKDYVYFWVPFSLLVIAKSLLDEGLVDVLIFDGNQHDLNAWRSLLDRHLDRTLCIGMSIMTGGGQIGHALRLAEEAKSRAKCPPVVFGGPHVNVLGSETAQHPLADAVLVGPGQNSMPSFVRAMLGEFPLGKVPGLIMRRDGAFLKGSSNSPRTQQLGQYPWNLVPVEDYVRDDACIAPRTLNYVSSQGCVYQCRFCYELTYQRKFSAISAPDLLDDIDDLVRRYHLSGIKFYDADWFIDLHRATDFAEGLLHRQIAIKWAASINPNDVLNSRRKCKDLLGLIARSGCRRILMGVESGSDRVLEEIVKKQITRDAIFDVASEIARSGIIGAYTFIVGFPGETEAEITATYDFIEELRQLTPPPETRVHLFAPYPGTPLYDVALAHGYNPPKSLEEWSHYDYYDSQTPWTDRDMVGRARFHTFLRTAPRSGRPQ